MRLMLVIDGQVHTSFNPRPALRPGDAHGHVLADVRQAVSIRARP